MDDIKNQRKFNLKAKHRAGWGFLIKSELTKLGYIPNQIGHLRETVLLSFNR